jgi:uncharacterized protein YndB with AHSA1/START domain
MAGIVVEMEYPHAPQRVWRALTDRRAIADWLMENDFVPRVGHRFTFRTKPAPGFDGVVHCEVLEVEEPNRLVYSWQGGGIDTTVTWTLEPTAGGTRLQLVHDGFKGIRGRMIKRILEKGWRSKILVESLPRVLDTPEPVETR